MQNRQYFSRENNELKSDKTLIKAFINDMPFSFYTDNGVFSKDYVDYATKLLLENTEFDLCEGKILDLGCGYGVVGVYMNKALKRDVVLTDVNLRALELSRENLSLNGCVGEVIESDSYQSIGDMNFAAVISNPPIHAGKEVIYRMFTETKQHLLPDGTFYVVIQEKHGAPSAVKKLKELFEFVEVYYKKKGFYLIKCKLHA